MVSHETNLYFDIELTQYPIVYHDNYNVRFGGLERLHVFDANKWSNIIEGLKAHGFRDNEFVEPREATKKDLQVVHTRRYLRSLKWSYRVAFIAEVHVMAFLPNILVQRLYLKPMRFQVGGSILAGKLALDRGWAINIGGGFHHCSANRGGGFCVYADITLTIRFLMNREMIKTAMIVDLDAHQGNGYERDFYGVKEVYIMDMYNRNIYPRDRRAKRAITRRVEVKNGIEDEDYLFTLTLHLRLALREFKPDILIYNAGTDILRSDPLGGMSISIDGVIKRDHIVFEQCRMRKIPIVMLTSGGYRRETAAIIADSINNLRMANLIGLPRPKSECKSCSNKPAKPAMLDMHTMPALPAKPAMLAMPTMPALPTKPGMLDMPTMPAMSAMSVILEMPTMPAMPAKPDEKSYKHLSRSGTRTHNLLCRRLSFVCRATSVFKNAKLGITTMPAMDTKPAKPARHPDGKSLGNDCFVMPDEPAMLAMSAIDAKYGIFGMPTMPALPAKPAMLGMPAMSAKAAILGMPTMPAMPAKPDGDGKSRCNDCSNKPDEPAILGMPTMPAIDAKHAILGMPTMPAMDAKPAKLGMPTMPAMDTKPDKLGMPTMPAKPAKPARHPDGK